MSLLNILWKKDSSKTTLYADIFAIKGYEIESDFRKKKKSCKQSHRDNRLAEEARDRGKQFFGRGQHFEAMEKFNKCLALAEIGTAEMGLAYANRSACYVRLNMPMNAMIDIDLAKAANYPAQLMHKLNERHQKCFIRLTSETFQPAVFTLRDPQLSFKYHEKFDGAADCLKIQRNTPYGRHIITKCDLEVGQIVLNERPYAIVPNQQSTVFRNRCMHCMEKFKNFISCEECGGSFCYSEGCLQTSDHKNMCNIPYFGPKHTFDLVLKMVFNINEAFPEVDKLLKTIESLGKNDYYMADLTGEQQKAFCSIFQMNHNHDKQSDEQLKNLQQATACAYYRIVNMEDFKGKFVTERHHRFLKHLVLHLFHIAQNAVDLYDYKKRNEDEDQTFEIFANGIYPIGSYINHSCIPNVHCYSNAYGNLVCQVIRKIHKGEQLLRSYFPPLWKFDQHRNLITKLQQKYHFKCVCIICTGNIRLPTADEVNFTTNKLYKEGIALAYQTVADCRKLPVATIEKHEKSAIKFLEMYGRFHPIRETINIENALIIMWSILVKDYSY